MNVKAKSPDQRIPGATRAILLAATTFVMSGLLAASAGATEPPQALWQKCELGGGAGMCTVPWAVVANQTTGNVYIVDRALLTFPEAPG